MIFNEVINERNQAHETRIKLYEAIEDELGRPVVTFFNSFAIPTMIRDRDADMLEAVLKDMDLSDGLALIISSPGGEGLAAERIIRSCRAYSGTDEYWGLVPNKAKSAATMICFGASKVYMGETSELGPIDPQIPQRTPDGVQLFSAHDIINTYNDLLEKARKESGNIEPYLLQLKRYDARFIRKLDHACKLSRDIAVQSLQDQMLKGVSASDIEDQIEVFLTPEQTKSHGRPIYREEADGCGLNVEDVDNDSKLWDLVYNLYVRLNDYVSREERIAKVVESRDHSFYSGSSFNG